jgi:hypothetical protein
MLHQTVQTGEGRDNKTEYTIKPNTDYNEGKNASKVAHTDYNGVARRKGVTGKETRL